MPKIIAANWKENPATEAQAVKLFSDTAKIKRGKDVEVVVCPPVVYLESIAKKFHALRSKSGLALGAQDVFWEEQGAYTSEIGALMLESFGVSYVIIGHSERRRLLRETDTMVNKKVLAALGAGLKVILCVGEPLVVRKKGIAAAKKFVGEQLKKDLKDINKISGSAGPRLREGDRKSGDERRRGNVERNLIVAYEPIWAIGSGLSDSPKDALEMANFIKKFQISNFKFQIHHVLYGGSVNGKNSRDYIHCRGIDGALVGGASLKPDDFGKIVGSS